MTNEHEDSIELDQVIDEANAAIISEDLIRQMSIALAERDITPEEVSNRLVSMSLYQSLTKDAAGDAHIHDLFSIKLGGEWDKAPKWPMFEPAPQVKITGTKVKRGKLDADVAVVLPDIQAGYFRDEFGRLVPTHDEYAVNLALQIVRDAKPKQVVMVGDNLDFPHFGKYRLSPAYQFTTMPSLIYMSYLCARIRANVPDDCEIFWLAGNHEERLPNYIIENASAAFGIRQSMDLDGWPVLSVPHLCNLDDHRVTFLPGYPANVHWITDKLKVIHGHKVNSNGSTVHKYLATEKVSTIFGHIHRREYGAITRQDRDGLKEIMAASPGCLARIDGAVPSVKGGVDLDGRPLKIAEDWQQGVSVVTILDEKGNFDYECARIDPTDHFALWRGHRYEFEPALEIRLPDQYNALSVLDGDPHAS